MAIQFLVKKTPKTGYVRRGGSAYTVYAGLWAAMDGLRKGMSVSVPVNGADKAILRNRLAVSVAGHYGNGAFSVRLHTHGKKQEFIITKK